MMHTMSEGRVDVSFERSQSCTQWFRRPRLMFILWALFEVANKEDQRDLSSPV
jgi:hypothetical protein